MLSRLFNYFSILYGDDMNTKKPTFPETKREREDRLKKRRDYYWATHDAYRARQNCRMHADARQRRKKRRLRSWLGNAALQATEREASRWERDK